MKTCKKCGCNDRFANGSCKECNKKAVLKYKNANPEKVKESRRKSDEKHKEKRIAAWAKYYAENKERLSAEKIQYRENNSEKVKQFGKSWRLRNLDKCRIYVQNRRALRIANGGKLSSELPDKLYKLQKGKCACCGLPLGDDYHMDHIMPLALGGANEDWNIQLLRQRCNNQKSVKHPVDFMVLRGFLL